MDLNALEDFSVEEELHSQMPLLDRALSAAQSPASTSVGKNSM